MTSSASIKWKRNIDRKKYTTSLNWIEVPCSFATSKRLLQQFNLGGCFTQQASTNWMSIVQRFTKQSKRECKRVWEKVRKRRRKRNEERKGKELDRSEKKREGEEAKRRGMTRREERNEDRGSMKASDSMRELVTAWDSNAAIYRQRCSCTYYCIASLTHITCTYTVMKVEYSSQIYRFITRFRYCWYPWNPRLNNVIVVSLYLILVI